MSKKEDDVYWESLGKPGDPLGNKLRERTAEVAQEVKSLVRVKQEDCCDDGSISNNDFVEQNVFESDDCYGYDVCDSSDGDIDYDVEYSDFYESEYGEDVYVVKDTKYSKQFRKVVIDLIVTLAILLILLVFVYRMTVRMIDDGMWSGFIDFIFNR